MTQGKKKSTFITQDSVPDDHFIDTFGAGVNRKIPKAKFFKQIRDNAQTFVYKDIADLQAANLEADPDDPVFVRVAETGFWLYQITSLAATALDISLTNGTTATRIYEETAVVPLSDITSIADLNTAALVDGQQFNMTGWRTGSDLGGGSLYYDATRPQTDHDGGTVFAIGATLPADFNDPAQIEAYLNAGSGLSGNGCLVRLNTKELTPEMFGGGVASSHAIAVRAAISALNDLGGGVVDASRSPASVTVDIDLFDGAENVTLKMGSTVWEFDTSNIQQRPGRDCVIHLSGAVLQPTVDGAGGIAGLGIGMFTNSLSTHTASITSGSDVIELSSGHGVRPGDAFTVRGFEGAEDSISSTLAANIDSTQTTIALSDGTDFQSTPDMAVKIGSEWITGDVVGNDLTNAVRGAFGTTAQSHSLGDPVLSGFDRIVKAIAVDGNSITVGAESADTMTDTRVRAGACGVRYIGSGIFSGRKGASDTQNLVAIEGLCCSGLFVSPGIIFSGWDHGGVFLRASEGFNVNGTYLNNGRPSLDLGADIWVFGGCRDGLVTTLGHVGSNYGFYGDGKSATLNFGLIGPNSGIRASLGPMASVSIGALLTDTSRSFIEASSIVASSSGIGITYSSGQWTVPPKSSNNRVTVSHIDSSVNALSIASDLEGANNSVSIGSVGLGVVERVPGNYVEVLSEKRSSTAYCVLDGGLVDANNDLAGVLQSSGVVSVVKNAVGEYTVNLNSDLMVDANYSVIASAARTGVNYVVASEQAGVRVRTSFRMTFRDDTNTLVDPPLVSIEVKGK